MSNTEILSEALNLPLTERLFIVNKLIESFNKMDSDIEKSWAEELNARKELLEKGQLKTINYKEFFGEN